MSEKEKSVLRSIYISPEMEADIIEFADKDGRSFNKMVQMLITSAMKERKRQLEKNKKKPQKED